MVLCSCYVDVANFLRVDGELVGADGVRRTQRVVVRDHQSAAAVHPQLHETIRSSFISDSFTDQLLDQASY